MQVAKANVGSLIQSNTSSTMKQLIHIGVLSVKNNSKMDGENYFVPTLSWCLPKLPHQVSIDRNNAFFLIILSVPCNELYRDERWIVGLWQL